MKNNSGVSMRSLMGWISLLGMLGFLVSMSVFASESVINISIDPANALQHIGSVKIIQEDNAVDHATIGSIGSGLLSVQTKANILLGSGDNQFLDGSIYSTILGGKENVITGGGYSTIIAGVKNGIGGGQANTILGGLDNKIGGSSSFSTIAGGTNNRVSGNSSTIVGGGNNQITGDYSVIVGNKNAVSGNNSVAVGKDSKVNANNSFLWRDSEDPQNSGLNVDNVFAVVSRRGMVINASSPNQYAQLTIGGPLVVGMNDNDENAICGSGVGGGTMKTVFMGERYCLCSCDGNSRNSMFGQGQCQSICHGEPMQPVCGTGVDRVACGGVYTFRGTCESGYVVNGTGAYFVDRNNVVHWTCQTSDGTSVACSSSDITQVSNCPENCHHATLGTVLDGHSVTAYLSNNPAGECHGISRTCRNGSLDGDSSYNSPTCNGGCRIPWSNEYIAEGGTIQAYNRNVAPYGESCGNPMIRRCHNGSFDGPDEYKRENCTEETANYCVHEGTKYAHLSNLVTYNAGSYQCPDECNADVRVGRCYNGKWLDAKSDIWKNDTELVEGINPEELLSFALYSHIGCVSKDSSNINEYTLAECPGGGVCTSGTVYFGLNNLSYEQESCTGAVKYKLNGCKAGYYQSGDSCVLCPTGYTSNTGATSSGQCFQLPQCGSANLGYFATQPISHLCSEGTSSGMTGENGIVFSGNDGVYRECPNYGCRPTEVLSWSWKCSKNIGGEMYEVTCGANKAASCANPCADGARNPAPIPHGSSKTCYKSTSVNCPNSCDSQTRTCYNGEWSNGGFSSNYTKSSCSVTPSNTSYILIDCPDWSSNCISAHRYDVSNNSCVDMGIMHKITSCKSPYYAIPDDSNILLCGTNDNGAGNNGCFLAGTPVLTPDGSKNIEDIEVGDLVLSYDASHNFEYNKVLDKFVHENSIDDVYTFVIDGDVLEATALHPFYVVGGANRPYQCSLPYRWKSAKNLKVGEQLMMSDGSLVTIDEISHRSNFSTIYNLLVDDAHTYFVGRGYLVHNGKVNPTNPSKPDWDDDPWQNCLNGCRDNFSDSSQDFRALQSLNNCTSACNAYYSHN